MRLTGSPQALNILWKLVYKDAGDDTLAKFVLKDGKIAGFWLQ